MTGPRAAEGGYDYMMQGLAGWQSLTGDPDGPPTKSGISLVDLSGGYASTIALLAGLWRARRDGVGCDCDVSLFETALHELMYIGPWAATHGYVPPRMPSSAHPSIVPFQNFQAKDGWFVVAAAKQKFWERLCEVTGHPELNEDARFATMAARHENRDVLLPLLEAIFRRADGGRVAGTARTGGRPEREDQLRPRSARGGADGRTGRDRRARAPVARDGEDDRLAAAPVRTSDGEDLRAQPPARGPFRGEHTEQVLVEYCGYSPMRVRELAEAGVFGDVALAAQMS